MAKKTFDYWYTCPILDKEITSIQETLEANINGLISDISPYIPEDALAKLAEQYAGDFYMDIESYIESVRSANSDIRNAAEKQIEEHQTEINNLEYDLNTKTYECNELEKTVAQLEDEVDALEDYIKELKQTINDSE